MSKTSIEWCCRPGTLPETWNLVTGCNKVSQGCKNCYAETMHKRLQFMYPKKYDHEFLSGAHIHEELLTLPFTWKKPRTVFVNSMSDLFHANVPISFLHKVYAVMALCPQHTFIIVTKRPENMKAYFAGGKELLVKRWEDATYQIGLSDKDDDTDAPACQVYNLTNREWPLKNIWHLVSVEDQKTADERIPLLLQIPSAVRGLSCEPLLMPINLKEIRPGGTHFFNCLSEPVLHKGYMPLAKGLVNWVIVGGESGHKAKPMHPDWVRSIREQCAAAGVPFFFKQWGESIWTECDFRILSNPKIIQKDFAFKRVGKKAAGRQLDGKYYNEFPQ